MPRLAYDVVERAGWTGAQAALSVLAVEVADVPAWWTAPLCVALAVAKSLAASRIGKRGTAATLPASKDPASTPMVPGL